tara:strand:- start:5321 stop:5497 length:177 start_codon:yes stop_codon:yes gene_type:complete
MYNKREGRRTMRCDNCGDGLSFSFGEVNTFSLGRPYHKYCYEKNVKSIHDEYRKENHE